jgi:hypothetical protein
LSSLPEPSRFWADLLLLLDQHPSGPVRVCVLSLIADVVSANPPVYALILIDLDLIGLIEAEIQNRIPATLIPCIFILFHLIDYLGRFGIVFTKLSKVIFFLSSMIQQRFPMI